MTIVPDDLALAPSRERRVRAEPRDAEGRRIRSGVEARWSADRDELIVAADGLGATVAARTDALPGLEATLHVEARAGDRVAEAAAHVVVVLAGDEEAEPAAHAGIPDPELVADPSGDWRSRYDGRRWQVNEAHEDFIALRADARARLRYLFALFAKEMVLRSYGAPGSERLLEHLVEVLAYAERNLRAPEKR